jgi:hypothetical protein
MKKTRQNSKETYVWNRSCILKYGLVFYLMTLNDGVRTKEHTP